MTTENPITHIKHVTIKGLWGDPTKNLEWTLNPDVNILAGGNGTGKSTVLMTVLGSAAKRYGFNFKIMCDSITITMSNNKKIVLNKTNEWAINDEVKTLHYIIKLVRTNSYLIRDNDINQKNVDNKVQTSLDLQLYNCIKDYKDYQIDLGNKVMEQINKGKNDIAAIYATRTLFFDILDELFAITQKKVNRTHKEIEFSTSNGKIINCYDLSSGEKLLIIILLNVLATDNKKTILFLDEPEVSLDTDWQEVLIDKIRLLNPNVQLIIATHSPFIISNGWADPHYVQQIENLFVTETNG